jgi:hypothetical protein
MFWAKRIGRKLIGNGRENVEAAFWGLETFWGIFDDGIRKK